MKVLKMIGLVLKDVFTSKLVKYTGLGIGILLLGCILAGPSLYVLTEVYPNVPVVKYITIIESSTDVSPLEETTAFKDIVSAIKENPWLFIPIGFLGLLFVFMLIWPLIALLLGLFGVFIVCCLLFVIFTFFRDLPKTIRRYRKNLEERLK